MASARPGRETGSSATGTGIASGSQLPRSRPSTWLGPTYFRPHIPAERWRLPRPGPALSRPCPVPASDAAGDPALAVVGRHAPARERPSLSFQGGEGRGPWSAKHWKRQPQTQLFPSLSPCSVPWNPAFRSRKASLHCLHLRNSFTPRRDYTLEQTSEESGCPGVLQPVFPTARLVSLKDARDGCSRVDGVCPRVPLRP